MSSVRDVQCGRASMVAAPAVPGSQGGGFADTGASDAAGTAVSFDSAPLASEFDVAGVPVLTVTLDAPSFGAGTDPATKLVLFAKLYDADESGSSALLPRNLISPVRIGDLSKPVRIELPGIVHRFPKGHRLRLTLATSTLSSRGNNAAGPVSVVVDPASPATLTLPRLGRPTGPAGSGPSGTTPFGIVPGALKPQKPGAGGPKRARPAAFLPSAAALRSCASRRKFRVRLRRVARPDRLRSAVVRVNGKRVKVRRRSGRAGATVDLRGLPRGAFRMEITVRTARGKTLRSARTYRTCVGKKRG